MKQIILALMLAVAGIGAAVAANPIREGNMISGHVLVKGSEENIPYATVLIVGSGQGTVSNEEGQFEFKNLPAGKYTLRVSAVGYKTQEKAIEVNKDFTAVVHFQMEEESFMTDEVVVSANRNEVSRKAAPVVVNVMSAKLFEMVNSTDLAKTLNYQSGLRVENNCQNCGFPQVRINGSGRPVLANPDKQPSRHQCAERGIWAGADTGEHDREGRGGTRRRFGAVRRQCCGRNYQYHHQRPH